MTPLRGFAVAVVFACASGAAGGGASRSATLTAQEIASYNTSVATALDAVQRLRPSWLIARGVKYGNAASDSTEYAYIYIDGQPAGKIGTLQDIEAQHVADITYYDVARAQAKFGILGSKSGVIEVRLRHGTRE